MQLQQDMIWDTRHSAIREKLSWKILFGNSRMNHFFTRKTAWSLVDDIELLEDTQCHLCNLNLTYAVRDGLISHCGEIDENHLKPRTQRIDLRSQFQYSGQYQPFTWEGCVVKVSDKIAYLGRDIEDAARLNFLDEDSHTILTKIGEVYHVPSLHMVNTSALISTLISDLCQHSNPLTAYNFRKIFCTCWTK